jgi:hypothetical protein
MIIKPAVILLLIQLTFLFSKFVNVRFARCRSAAVGGGVCYNLWKIYKRIVTIRRVGALFFVTEVIVNLTLGIDV